MTDADVPHFTPADSEFDDFGPGPAITAPLPANLDGEAGGLSVDLDAALVGFVNWYPKQWGPGSGSQGMGIGIWLMSDRRGQGIGSAAQRRLAEMLFLYTPINRIEAETDAGNIAEQRALERAGFSRDGLLRGACWRHGSHRDVAVYGLLRAETG